ncbi:DUF6194 family protein [Nocardia callitridis]|uniref:DUF6194 domain-containing protein n=1 Tax=Nocardia callitridis TaxID=648753 RepID=A0ABP9KNA7_9NOCA
MRIDDILALVASREATLAVQPTEGDGTPEIAWGDTFFYYAPNGSMPEATQPFATIVTKDYPGDTDCRLDRPDAFRLNVAVGTEEFRACLGYGPRESNPTPQPVRDDTVIAHPTYASAGWVAVVNPGPATEYAVGELLHRAYVRAVAAHDRKAARKQ